jgi:hypothetical protein
MVQIIIDINDNDLASLNIPSILNEDDNTVIRFGVSLQDNLPSMVNNLISSSIIHESFNNFMSSIGNNFNEFFEENITDEIIQKKLESPYVYDGTDENDCDICKINYKKDDHIRKLKCNHYYHKNCIDEWLKRGTINNPNTCPICRVNPFE